MILNGWFELWQHLFDWYVLETLDGPDHIRLNKTSTQPGFNRCGVTPSAGCHIPMGCYGWTIGVGTLSPGCDANQWSTTHTVPQEELALAVSEHWCSNHSKTVIQMGHERRDRWLVLVSMLSRRWTCQNNVQSIRKGIQMDQNPRCEYRVHIMVYTQDWRLWIFTTVWIIIT